MRNGVGWARRLATGIAIALVAVMAMSTGAGAATTLDSYSATASGTTFNVSVQLPAALSGVLNNVLGSTGSKIEERISFSNASSNVIKDKAPVGSAFGQVFKGTLDNLLLQVAKSPLIGYTGAKLPEASASLGQRSAANLKAIDLGPVHVGIAEAAAWSKKNATNPRIVDSHSESRLLGVTVDLRKLGVDLENVLQPVIDLVDGSEADPDSGLIDTINAGLDTIETTVKDTTGLVVDLTLPSIRNNILNAELVKVGIIESVSDTFSKGAARVAQAKTKLAGVKLLGDYIKVDVLEVTSYAQIDGTAAGARPTHATQRIAGLKIGGNIVNLDAGSLTVAGKTIDLGQVAGLTDSLKSLVNVLGLELALAPKPTIVRSATHASAAASTLHLGLAPKLSLTGDAAPLFSISLDGPAAVADVRGSNVLGITTVAHPRTGVSDRLFLLVGPALLGLAIVTRKFVLAK